MGSYEVVQPCIVGATHYTRREVGTSIEVDDKAAKPLVDAGALRPVGAAKAPEPEPSPEPVPAVEDVEPPAAAGRGARADNAGGDKIAP